MAVGITRLSDLIQERVFTYPDRAGYFTESGRELDLSNAPNGIIYYKGNTPPQHISTTHRSGKCLYCRRASKDTKGACAGCGAIE
jgi:hypothetical protein